MQLSRLNELARFACIALSLCACAHEPEEGGRCEDDPNECIDGASLWNCASGRWHRVQCSDYCASIGEVNGGCLESATGPECHCVPDGSFGPSCTAEDALTPRCTALDAIESCVDGHIRTEPCYLPCDRAGFDASTGCFQDPVTFEASCSCVRFGDPCAAPGHPTCIADYAIFHCTRGVGWQVAFCDDVCAPAPAIGCGGDISGISSCLCGESATTDG